MPETEGEGVQFADGVAVYRELVHDEWTPALPASVAGIEESYGGQNDYEFHWLDGDSKSQDRRFTAMKDAKRR